MAAADDDGGVIASSGQNWHWRRVKPIEADLTIEHFGGIADGVFNNHDAIVAMYLYARNRNNNGFQAVDWRKSSCGQYIYYAC